MIPERFSLSNLEFGRFEPIKIRLKAGNGYCPLLYTSNIEDNDVWYGEYDIDGFRIPESILHSGPIISLGAGEFYQVYKEHFEDYKLAIQKLLVKEML